MRSKATFSLIFSLLSFLSYLFSLIFSPETTILEKREERREKREERRENSEENKRNDNLLSKIVVSFWSWWRDLNPRPIDYESIALPLRHTSIHPIIFGRVLHYSIFILYCQYFLPTRANFLCRFLFRRLLPRKEETQAFSLLLFLLYRSA